MTFNPNKCHKKVQQNQLSLLLGGDLLNVVNNYTLQSSQTSDGINIGLLISLPKQVAL